MKGKLTDGVLALISAASNLYPLVTQRTQGRTLGAICW